MKKLADGSKFSIIANKGGFDENHYTLTMKDGYAVYDNWPGNKVCWEAVEKALSNPKVWNNFKIILDVEEPTQGVKHDDGKLRWDLLPFDSLDMLADVLTFGSTKYDDNNWLHVDNPIQRYTAAYLRHTSSHMQGELIDQESGKPHLACAFSNLSFLLHFYKDEFTIAMNEWKQQKEPDNG